MKKILFLVQLPPPVHGASVVNKNIKDSLVINGEFNARYVNISPAKGLSDIGRLSVSKILTFFGIFIRTIYTYLKFKPDLVYVTLSPHGLALYKDGLLAIVIRALGGKLVFHFHGKGIVNESKKSWFKKKFYLWIFKDVDIIHLSEILFIDVDKVRDHTRSIYAIANGISPDLYSRSIKKAEIFTFVYLSNLVRAKGADCLIRAAALLKERGVAPFYVKIIGGKSTESFYFELKNLITPGLSNSVGLVGPMYGEDKINALASSHVFVLPTKNDCFPLSILEAMSSNLAVISTNEGAIPDIVDQGVTGEILIDTTPEILADAMMKHIEDQKYSEICANAGRKKYLELYTTDIFTKKLCATLNQIIESRY